MNCRLCDRNINGKNGLLLYDYSENLETRLGRKISIILNSSEKYDNLSNYCCNVCSYKIEVCFSLLVEIQASDEVIRQTYENLANGRRIDTASQLFICGECKATVAGIKLFIKHYENHILKKTTVGSKKDVAVPGFIPYDSKGNSNNCKNFSSNEMTVCINSSYHSNFDNDNRPNETKYNLEDSNLLGNESENDAGVSDQADNFIDECSTQADYEVNNDGECSNDNEINLDVDDSVYDLKPSSPDEFEDRDFNDYFDSAVQNESDSSVQNESDSSVQNESDSAVQNESDSAVQNESDELGKRVSHHDLNDIVALSEDSFSSDVSYTNLVNIVKKELEKSDSDEEHKAVSRDENGMYTCETCNISFEYKFILKYHLDKNHEAFHDLDIAHIRNITNALENDYNVLMKCCYCKNIYPAPEIKDHVMECREEYSLNRKMLCQVCGKLFRFRELEKHLNDHSKIVWPCELCGKIFKAKRFLKSHLGEHDETKKKICEICGKKLLPLSFFSHVMKHREKRHVCQYCGKAFTYNYGLRLHMKVHEDKKMESRPEKKRDKVFCWFCKKDFDCAISLNKHLRKDHNAEGVEQDSRFPCAQCDKKFADMFSLKAHLKLMHEMKDEDIARLKSLPVYRYIECNVCYKVFNSENKIRIHMKQDHGLKPFEMEILKKECEKCGKKFASKQNLIHHINGAHLHIKPMTCDICQEKFAKHSSLIYHKLRHSGEKPFQCEFCQKSYRQRNDVIRHLARHVRDKELTLEEASAVNNSPSRLVIKRRIFLKDSSINYKTIVKKNRKKSDVVKMEPILEEEVNEIQEEQMEFTENGIADSMLYVEEVPVDENQRESPSDMPYINAKPIYDEERNTIILSSPDVIKNSVKNVTYRYIPSLLKHMPAVIVKKQEQI